MTITPAVTTCTSVWHRTPAPDVQVAVWKVAAPEGVTYAVGLHGNGLDRLSPEQADQLIDDVRKAARFARREQDLADTSRRRTA